MTTWDDLTAEEQQTFDPDRGAAAFGRGDDRVIALLAYTLCRQARPAGLSYWDAWAAALREFHARRRADGGQPGGGG